MFKKTKFLFIAILMLCFIKNVNALKYGGCEYSTISNLKMLVSNINVSYTYEINDNKAYFNVILNNIPRDVYFIDINTGNKYYYENTNNGEIVISGYNNDFGESGQYKFFINNNICNGIKLGTKYYKIPPYNNKYNSELCKDLENFSLCKKWSKNTYTDEEFKQKIEEYKNVKNEKVEETEIKYEKDTLSKVVQFYIKYYYLFLPAIILICIIIMVISKKRNSFKL